MLNQNQKKKNDLRTYYKTDHYLVLLDSRNATTYNNGSQNSDVTFEMQYPITLPQDCLDMTMTVYSFVCPVSWYLINLTNNYLSISANNTAYGINVPYGNYNINTFQSTLQALLPVGFQISFNSLTNAFSLTFSSIFFINSTSTIYGIMGFAKNTSYVSTNNSLAMPYTCNFAGLNTINILLENIKTSNLDSKDQLTSSSIIANVPVSASNNIIYFEKRNDFEFDVKEKCIDYLDVVIQDGLGNKIDFNNQNWDLVIQVNYNREVVKTDVNSFNDILFYGNSD